MVFGGGKNKALHFYMRKRAVLFFFCFPQQGNGLKGEPEGPSCSVPLVVGLIQPVHGDNDAVQPGLDYTSG